MSIWIIIGIVCWVLFTIVFAFTLYDEIENMRDVFSAFICCVVFPLGFVLLIQVIWTTLAERRIRKRIDRKIRNEMEKS